MFRPLLILPHPQRETPHGVSLCLFNKSSGGTGFIVPPLCFFGGCRSLLPVWFGLDGVICSMPASDILTAVISVVLIKKTYRQLRESESGVAFSIEA